MFVRTACSFLDKDKITGVNKAKKYPKSNEHDLHKENEALYNETILMDLDKSKSKTLTKYEENQNLDIIKISKENKKVVKQKRNSCLYVSNNHTKQLSPVQKKIG